MTIDNAEHTFGFYSPARGPENERGEPFADVGPPPELAAGWRPKLTPFDNTLPVRFARDREGAPTLIGLTGHKGSGKDTVAAMLGAYGYERVAFADPLKAIAREIGWDGDKAERYPCPCCGMLQGRALLQVLGTEGVRQNIRDDAWLLAAEQAIARRSKVVITDVRFPNEAEFVRSRGGEVWRVLRPGFEGDGHASETEIDQLPVDRILWNRDTLERLRDVVEFAYARVLPA